MPLCNSRLGGGGIQTVRFDLEYSSPAPTENLRIIVLAPQVHKIPL